MQLFYRLPELRACVITTIKLLVITRDAQLVFSVVLLLLTVQFLPAFVTNKKSFIKAFARLRICLFHYVFCRNLAKLDILVQLLVHC